MVENPDRICVHLPKRCTICGREIPAEEPYEVVSRRQVFDLPQPRLEVTEHRLGQVECCGQKQRGEYPDDVRSRVQYGPGV
jgi:transposase